MTTSASAPRQQPSWPRRHSFFAFLLLLLSLSSPPSSSSVVVVVRAALVDPDFWDVPSPSYLTALASESAPHFRPLSHMGHTARLCDDLPGYRDEEAVRLSNATVVVDDYDLLCSDFPETCDMDRDKRDEWLLDRAGRFSSAHIDWLRRRREYYEKLGAKYEDPYEVPHDDDPAANAGAVVGARRACAGGRALLFPSSSLRDDDDGEKEDADGRDRGPPGWIDAKGVGALRPRTYDESVPGAEHADGVLPLFDALYEFLNEKTVSAALDHHSRTHPNKTEEHFTTVGIYAVLSLGFDFPMRTAGPLGEVRYAAGAVARQAARRHPNPYGYMHPPDAFVLEQILNSYGLRSDGPQNDYLFRNLPNPSCRRVNLQGTVRPRTLTDFGPIQGTDGDDEDEWPPRYEEGMPAGLGGEEEEEGRREGECLVHWLHTGKKVEPELWKRASEGGDGDDFGSAEVRAFLRSEFRPRVDEDEGGERTNGGAKGEVCPSPSPPTNEKEGRRGIYPARTTDNARIRRMLELEECWYWEGSCGRDRVDAAVSEGSIDDLLDGAASSSATAK